MYTNVRIYTYIGQNIQERWNNQELILIESRMK